ncbi:anaerobic coproporphyrinogen III oxidase [Idiomarina loihiensis]|uniref:radical SAM family heme chaperone HemW n=1 Tax=Idiomarina TaxID=135575 RepID=UPI000D712610|nr:MULTISPECIES: radical SAM family heme chaperone HemW [Idiomarina]PWW35813.1 anaerobic coproporphyrinogen III oxidase [Idiomarina loihiensis]TDP45814.1 anaerobic coproporphyrinogen III oxidase [Idiomarina loihiensis]TDS21212.1 anaerobic coproporphyrinogen III oxidase [Idiomarina sp. H2]
MTSPLTLPPLSLYIHIPWCIQKCPYCDFNSHKLTGDVPEASYVGRLLEDLRADIDWVQGREIQSIFIGGGTPSVLSAKAIQQLMDGVRSIVALSPDCEVTMEANPGTFETEKFSAFVAAGINRLSIGVQSLQEHQLQRLGRIHNPQQAKDAAAHASELPLSSFNLDLMHGLPDQTVEMALDDLRQVIALNPPHISWYQLTIEPNTLFASQPPELPDDDTLWEIYQQGHKLLEAAGYSQYEVSAYAKPGHQSRHNRNYWQYGDYLGIGCGAHSKVTLPQQNKVLRCEKVKHPKGYLDLTKPLRYQLKEVAVEDRLFEFFMNQFRLLETVSKSNFEQTTALSAELASKQLTEAKTLELVTEDELNWQLTQRGHRFLNSVLDTLLD